MKLHDAYLFEDGSVHLILEYLAGKSYFFIIDFTRREPAGIHWGKKAAESQNNWLGKERDSKINPGGPAVHPFGGDNSQGPKTWKRST